MSSSVNFHVGQILKAGSVSDLKAVLGRIQNTSLEIVNVLAIALKKAKVVEKFKTLLSRLKALASQNLPYKQDLQQVLVNHPST